MRTRRGFNLHEQHLETTLGRTNPELAHRPAATYALLSAFHTGAIALHQYELALSIDSRLERAPAPDSGYPLAISPREPGVAANTLARDLRRIAEQHLEVCGAILFRGFALEGVEAFRTFAASFGGALLNYDFASTPRKEMLRGVYTSTEYPAHQPIPLHNEQSYTRKWPMRIWFYCVTAPERGGETPIADSRLVYQRLDARLRRRFEERRLMYVRNSGNGLDVSWPRVFGTNDRQAVERYCQEHGIGWEWKPDGELRTRQVCQASARHPRTSEAVWFNQAHLFHISSLSPDTRGGLLEVVGEQDLPRNVYYGDGSPLEESALEEIRAVYADVQQTFPWQANDVLMLDNMLSAHGRQSYTGPRSIAVAMANEHSPHAKAPALTLI